MSICELPLTHTSVPCIYVLQFDVPYCRLPEPQSCDENTDELLRIEYLDVVSIYAHFAAALNDPQSHRVFLSCRGPIAQSLLNRTQRVSSFLPSCCCFRHAHKTQLVDVPHLDWRIKHRLLVFLVQLSRKSNLYPESLVVRGIHKNGRHLVDAGSFGDVWKGIMLGDVVAIKIMKIRDDYDFKPDKALKVRMVFLRMSTGLPSCRDSSAKLLFGDSCHIRTYSHSMAFIMLMAIEFLSSLPGWRTGTLSSIWNRLPDQIGSFWYVPAIYALNPVLILCESSCTMSPVAFYIFTPIPQRSYMEI